VAGVVSDNSDQICGENNQLRTANQRLEALLYQERIEADEQRIALEAAQQNLAGFRASNQRLEVEVARLTAAAKPDAELVASIREKFPRIDPCAPVPLDEKAHCCEYTIYVERERLHRQIDAKLAELQQ
jgi:hypothetical protein